MKVKKILKVLFMGVFLFIVTGNVLAIDKYEDHIPEACQLLDPDFD